MSANEDLLYPDVDPAELEASILKAEETVAKKQASVEADQAAIVHARAMLEQMAPRNRQFAWEHTARASEEIDPTIPNIMGFYPDSDAGLDESANYAGGPGPNGVAAPAQYRGIPQHVLDHMPFASEAARVRSAQVLDRITTLAKLRGDDATAVMPTSDGRFHAVADSDEAEALRKAEEENAAARRDAEQRRQQGAIDAANKANNNNAGEETTRVSAEPKLPNAPKTASKEK